MPDPEVPIHDGMSEARAAGFGWGEINETIGKGSQAAIDAGYHPDQINAFFGYKDPGLMISRMQSQAPDPLKLNEKPTSYGQSQGGSSPLTPEMAQHYATGLINGEVASPQGFAKAVLDSFYPNMSPEDKLKQGTALLTSMPGFQQATDAALGALNDAGESMDSAATRTARANLLNFWAATGEPPLKALNEDPLTKYAFTQEGAYGGPEGGIAPAEVWEKAATDLGDNLTKYFQGLGKDTLTRFSPEEGGEQVKGKPGVLYSPEYQTFNRGMSTALAVVGGGIQGAGEVGVETLSGIFRTLEGNASGKFDFARSPAGALGRHQIMPGTAAQYGFHDFDKLQNDVEYNTEAFNKIITHLQEKYNGNLREMAVAYNAGEGIADPWIASGYTKKLPDETVAYLAHGEKEGFFGPPSDRDFVFQQMEKLGKARMTRGPDIPPPEGIDVEPNRSGLDDALNRLRTNAIADKSELWKIVRGLPKEEATTEFQEKVSQEVEQRMVDLKSKFSDETRAFLDRHVDLTEMQQKLLKSIRELDETFDEGHRISSVEEGYVHRIAKGMEEGQRVAVDPSRDYDVITGGLSAGKSLTTRAAGALARAGYYVLEQHPEGIGPEAAAQREWGGKLENTNYKMGDKLKDPMGDHTVRPATMKEIEANTNIKYHKNFIANTVENVARLGRVERNLKFLKSHATDLKAKGLFAPFSQKALSNPPEGMVRVEIPQLNGWAEPKIGNTLNDFFNDNKGDLDGFLRRANRFLMASLFISPVTHAGNVAAHWFVGRGWDWLNPVGYGRLTKASVRALHQVLTLGPDYIDHMRYGSGLQYASTQTENFYKVIMSKLFHEQMGDANTWGSYAKSLGMKGVADLARWEYRMSRKSLWAANDVFLLSRQFELESKGMSKLEAIRQSEIDIPNYRVPSSVLGRHEISEILRSPNWMNFGRYKYGQIRSLAMMGHDLIAGTGRERWESIGKFTALGGLMFGIYPLLNTVLQGVTDNPDASVRNFGPTSILHGAYNLFAPLSTPETRWGAALSSLVTAAPVIEAADRIRNNLDVFGRPNVYDPSSIPQKALQAGEAGMEEFPPGHLMMQSFRGNPAGALGSLLGLKLPVPQIPGMQEKYQGQQEKAAFRHEQKDPINGWLTDHGVPSEAIGMMP